MQCAEFYTSIQYSSKKKKVLFTISLDKPEKGNRHTTTSCLIPEIKLVTSKKNYASQCKKIVGSTQ